jgi:hypothetical protein
MATEEEVLEREKHIRYFGHHLAMMPEPYTPLDTSRITAVSWVCPEKA